MSDLIKYCETRGISEMVVGDVWFRDAKGAVEGGLQPSG
jgi:hypothetical protein